MSNEETTKKLPVFGGYVDVEEVVDEGKSEITVNYQKFLRKTVTKGETTVEGYFLDGLSEDGMREQLK